MLAEGAVDVPAVGEPEPGSSKAATTPTMDLASISPPTTHIQIGILLLRDSPSAGCRLAVRASRFVGGDGSRSTGWRLAVQARPFQ